MPSADLQNRIRGLYTIMITPFQPDGSLDEEGLRTATDRLIAADVDGLIVNGTLGEFYAMSMEEIRRSNAIVAEHAAGRVPVFAGASHSSTQEAIDLAKAAEAAGADGVMLTPPYFSKPPAAGVIRHFELVSDAIEIGIMLYNTHRSGVDLTADLIDQLADIDNVVAIKQGSRDIVDLDRTITRAADRIAVLGVEESMLAAPAHGAVGFTSAGSGVFPTLIKAIWSSASAGDFERARRLNAFWEEYRTFHQVVGMPSSTHKAALRFKGLPSGPVRPPMIELTDAQVAEVQRMVTRIDRWEESLG